MKIISMILLMLTCGCASIPWRESPSNGEARLAQAIQVLKTHGQYPLKGEYDLTVRRSDESKMWMFCFWPNPSGPGGDLNVWIYDDGRIEYVRLP
jgi:hypothetical protein